MSVNTIGVHTIGEKMHFQSEDVTMEGIDASTSISRYNSEQPITQTIQLQPSSSLLEEESLVSNRDSANSMLQTLWSRKGTHSCAFIGLHIDTLLISWISLYKPGPPRIPHR